MGRWVGGSVGRWVGGSVGGRGAVVRQLTWLASSRLASHFSPSTSKPPQMAIVAVKLTMAKISAGTTRRGTSPHGKSVTMRCDGDEERGVKRAGFGGEAVGRRGLGRLGGA